MQWYHWSHKPIINQHVIGEYQSTGLLVTLRWNGQLWIDAYNGIIMQAPSRWMHVISNDANMASK